MVNQPVNQLFGNKAVGIRLEVVPPVLNDLLLVQSEPVGRKSPYESGAQRTSATSKTGKRAEPVCPSLAHPAAVGHKGQRAFHPCWQPPQTDWYHFKPHPWENWLSVRWKR